MKKFLYVLPILALSLVALPAISYAQGNINAGNTEAESEAPAEGSSQSGSGAQGN